MLYMTADNLHKGYREKGKGFSSWISFLEKVICIYTGKSKVRIKPRKTANDQAKICSWVRTQHLSSTSSESRAESICYWWEPYHFMILKNNHTKYCSQIQKGDRLVILNASYIMGKFATRETHPLSIYLFVYNQ